MLRVNSQNPETRYTTQITSSDIEDASLLSVNINSSDPWRIARSPHTGEDVGEDDDADLLSTDIDQNEGSPDEQWSDEDASEAANEADGWAVIGPYLPITPPRPNVRHRMRRSSPEVIIMKKPSKPAEVYVPHRKRAASPLVVVPCKLARNTYKQSRRDRRSARPESAVSDEVQTTTSGGSRFGGKRARPAVPSSTKLGGKKVGNSKRWWTSPSPEANVHKQAEKTTLAEPKRLVSTDASPSTGRAAPDPSGYDPDAPGI